MELFQLEVITQDKIIYKETAESLTAPAVEGEVTILSHHAPFFSKIRPGQLTIRKAGRETKLINGEGFIDVSPDNIVTVLVDSASRFEDIDIKKAQEAQSRAEQMLKDRQKLSRTEILRVEASLKKAVLELKIARRKRRQGELLSLPSES